MTNTLKYRFINRAQLIFHFNKRQNMISMSKATLKLTLMRTRQICNLTLPDEFSSKVYSLQNLFLDSVQVASSVGLMHKRVYKGYATSFIITFPKKTNFIFSAKEAGPPDSLLFRNRTSLTLSLEGGRKWINRAKRAREKNLPLPRTYRVFRWSRGIKCVPTDGRLH
jgi:hypothetical protein